MRSVNAPQHTGKVSEEVVSNDLGEHASVGEVHGHVATTVGNAVEIASVRTPGLTAVAEVGEVEVALRLRLPEPERAEPDRLARELDSLLCQFDPGALARRVGPRQASGMTVRTCTPTLIQKPKTS